jgi:hypothetical protein
VDLVVVETQPQVRRLLAMPFKTHNHTLEELPLVMVTLEVLDLPVLNFEELVAVEPVELEALEVVPVEVAEVFHSFPDLSSHLSVHFQDQKLPSLTQQ